ncbi:MAG: DUF5655 domain-containing protein [Candidatus Phosphoribacter sp.]|nr:DUF4287 domain-containing protein [Actinomycetales bacterium]
MTHPEQASHTQLRNIERDTGRSVAEWGDIVRSAGLERHGQILAFLKAEHSLTHGNANALALAVRALEAGPVGDEDLLAQQYAGPKAALRPTYEEIVTIAQGLGDDVVVSVKKTGVSLRRRKQFALVEAPSSRRVRLGLNLTGTPPTERLRARTGMCTHAVDIADPDDVDDEVATWLHQAYQQAG